MSRTRKSKGVTANPPALRLDRDGTIDEAPEFFRLLAGMWPGPVYVITYRARKNITTPNTTVPCPSHKDSNQGEQAADAQDTEKDNQHFSPSDHRSATPFVVVHLSRPV